MHLLGDLGAGKTTLARGFVQGCGIAGAVRSPTFTLMQWYEQGAQTLLHLDLYRLADPSELEHLGLAEWDRQGCLWLIEWPQRGGQRLPPADLIVTLTAGLEGHEADLTAGTATGASWLRRLTQQLADRPATPGS